MTHLHDRTLNEYLDETLDQERRQTINQHLAACAECRARLQQLRLVFEALEGVPDVPLEADLSTRVAAQIAAESRPWYAPWWFFLALAAQGLIAIILLIELWPVTQPLLADVEHTLRGVLSGEMPALALREGIATLTAQVALLYESARQMALTLTTAAYVPPIYWILLIILALIIWVAGNGLLLLKLEGMPNKEGSNG